ncbi:MAG: transglycosylase SLT domain-containing protein [Deltaproteobacteria bacterium]
MGRCKHIAVLFLALTVLPAASVAERAAAHRIPAELRVLASHADNPATWPKLLRYAEAQKDSEAKGLAYFVLGYSEYDADKNDMAIPRLQQAAATKFSLADFADFYAAAAANENHQPDLVIKTLAGFDEKYPDSTHRRAALQLYAEALIAAGKPDEAVKELMGNRRVRQDPELAGLLAEALQASSKPEEAARIYQEIYYAFPTSVEADKAEKSLAAFQTELGDKLPKVSEEIQTARADKLYSRGRYSDALKDYEALLGASPKSPFVARWTVGRARCLVRTGQIPAALDALQQAMPQDPAMDAERLSALVDIYARQDDPDSIELILAQLGKLYAPSPAYATALDVAGNYFVRKGDWPRAAGYYQPLAQLFPKTSLGLEASWRVAWAAYLKKDYAAARAGFEQHLKEYPDSWHRAAALYWMGRLAEDHGAGGAARKLYESVVTRHGQNYYAALASRRLDTLAENRLGFDSPQAGDWAAVSDVAGRLPALDPSPLAPCAPSERSEALGRAETLHALGLDDLAENYLDALTDRTTDSPEVYFALGLLESRMDKTAEALLDAVRAVNNYSDLRFDQLPKGVWDLLYPRSYWSLVQKESKARGLDPYWVMALIRQESAFNPRAISSANARGLMQILPQTAARRRSQRRWAARRLLDPAYNVRMGTGILQKLSASFDGDKEETMAAYHAGKSRVDEWRGKNDFHDSAEFLETIPIPATRIYVERVVRDAAVYRKLMTGTAGFASCHESRSQAQALEGAPAAAR